jgi:hypothetical protein
VFKHSTSPGLPNQRFDVPLFMSSVEIEQVEVVQHIENQLGPQSDIAQCLHIPIDSDGAADDSLLPGVENYTPKVLSISDVLEYLTNLGVKHYLESQGNSWMHKLIQQRNPNPFASLRIRQQFLKQPERDAYGLQSIKTSLPKKLLEDIKPIWDIERSKEPTDAVIKHEPGALRAGTVIRFLAVSALHDVYLSKNAEKDEQFAEISLEQWRRLQMPAGMSQHPASGLRRSASVQQPLQKPRLFIVKDH